MPTSYAAYRSLSISTPAPRVLEIVMDRADRLNAADKVMHAEMAAIWRDIDQDPDVSAVIVRGSGRGFSAGGDFELIEEVTRDQQARVRVWYEARDLVYNVINCSKPIVSAIH